MANSPPRRSANGERSESAERLIQTSQRRRLMIGGALLILAGAASLMMMVGGVSSMDAQNGEVEYFEVWLPPWFLLAEIMLFSSMAAVSIVTGATAMGRNVQGASTIGAICSLIGFGFMFGLPGLILVTRARRETSASLRG